jgi:cell division protein FtsX
MPLLDTVMTLLHTNFVLWIGIFGFAATLVLVVIPLAINVYLAREHLMPLGNVIMNSYASLAWVVLLVLHVWLMLIGCLIEITA